MGTVIYLEKRLNSFVPADAASEAAFREIPNGSTVRAECTRPRNLLHHRKFFALLQVIHPHQDTYPEPEHLLAAMKVALGYGDSVKLPDGRTIIIPGSISFAKMDQTAFERFYERAIELIRTKILPGVDREDLDREVEEIMAGHHNSSASLESHLEGDAGRGGAVRGQRAGKAGGAAPSHEFVRS